MTTTDISRPVAMWLCLAMIGVATPHGPAIAQEASCPCWKEGEVDRIAPKKPVGCSVGYMHAFLHVYRQPPSSGKLDPLMHIEVRQYGQRANGQNVSGRCKIIDWLPNNGGGKTRLSRTFRGEAKVKACMDMIAKACAARGK